MIITSFFGYQLSFLRADFEFERFFPTQDPDIEFYEQHLTEFNYDNDYLIAVITSESGIFDKPFLSEVIAFEDSVSRLTNITQVFSIATAQLPVKGPMGVTPLPLIHVSNPSRYEADSIQINQHPFFKNFISQDGKSLLIQINHEHLTNPADSRSLQLKLNELLHSFTFSNYHLVGKVIAQEAFVGYIQNDFVLFLAAALILSFVLLVFIFKSVKIALMPYLVSITSLVWLLGLMSWMGYSISVLGSLIPPVILFVSTSDSIHLINAFRNITSENQVERLQKAIHKVFIPTLLTSLTTAIGFFSLWSIDTLPIRELGLFAGIGICIAFIVTFLFGPLLIRRAYPPETQQTLMKKLAVWNLRNHKSILICWIVLIIVAAYGVSLVKTDAYLLKDLPEDSEVRNAFTLVDKQLGGSKPWEMALWPTDSSKGIFDYQVIREINKIETYLKDQYGMDRVISPASLVRFTNQMNNGGLTSQFALPDKDQHPRIIKSLTQLLKRKELPKVSANNSYGRIAAFIPEYGSHETIKRNQLLLEFIEKKINPQVLSTRLTGTTYLIDKSHEVLSYNLIKGLIIGILIISVLLGLYFRSIKVLLISLIPNIIPLIAVAGYMGLSGAPLKLTTSVIFAVTFGIAVDDTIHFLAVYRKSTCKSTVFKLINTYASAGKAILLTTVIIVSGFFLFILSSFGATYYLGLFMTISLLIALLTDLTLLPLLIHLFKTKETQR